MIKQTFLCISLLTATASLHALLESEILHYIDGTLVSWASVRSIKQYQKQIKHFLNEQYAIDGLEQKLFDLAVKEKNNTLSECEKEAFSTFVKKFIAFSEQFLVDLRPAKSGIKPLVEEFCHKRNRANSLLLRWAQSENQSEKELFTTHIKTYKALGELCMDLLNFTEELLSSCPKAMKAFNDLLDRFSKLEPLLDALLVADKVELSHHSIAYHELIRHVSEHYSNNEPVTAEKTAKLYHAYNIKSHL